MEKSFYFTNRGEVASFSPSIHIVSYSKPTLHRIGLSFIYSLSFFFCIGGIIFLINLREKKKLSALENHNRKLQERMNAMTLMVAHDLRSPISALQMVAEQDEFDETSREILLIAIERVSKIANELLETKKELKTESNMADVLKEITALNRGFSGAIKDNVLWQMNLDESRKRIAASPEEELLCMTIDLFRL